MVSAPLFRQHETDVSLRCLIVDDNAGFREEVRGLLEEQGIEVVGGAGTGAEAVQQVASSGRRSPSRRKRPRPRTPAAGRRGLYCPNRDLDLNP